MVSTIYLQKNYSFSEENTAAGHRQNVYTFI